MDKANLFTQLSRIELKNFRCFSDLKLDMGSPYIVIEGANGVGKTSILEALHFACYLRSFRTHTPRDLILFDKDSFFVKVNVTTQDQWNHDIQVGFTHNKRVVKVDQKAVSSYKDLMSYYRVVSLTEDDLSLIQGSPQFRRIFLDQILLLLDPEIGQDLKDYRQLVDQRNAFLQHKQYDHDTFHVFTQQLWNQASKIKSKRQEILSLLLKKVNHFSSQHISGTYRVSFSYLEKKVYYDSFEVFWKQNGSLFEQEKRFRRTLFGAHLDDIYISLQGQHSRIFASRGQQKLLLILLKMAQISLMKDRNQSTVFLLDDFMTDFDEKRMRELLESLESLPVQLVFTSPVQGSVLSKIIPKKGGNLLKLTI